MVSSRTLLLLATVLTSSVLTQAFQLVSPPMRTLQVKPAFSPETFSVSRLQRPRVVYASVAASVSAALPEENDSDTPEVDEEDPMEAGNKLTLVQRIKKGFAPQKDGLSFRQRLGKMGLSVFLSYGWVSNMSYCVTASLAWYIFSSKTGMSPLAPGQWKPYLAIYAGFYVFNSIIRPIRVAVAVSVSPFFDRVISGIQNRLKVNRTIAIVLTVVSVNLIGTLAIMCGCIQVAATAAGVPVFSKLVL